MLAIEDDEFPPAYAAIAQRTCELGFTMPSDTKTGSLLKVLAASKPGGMILELGTGTGLATAWLLAGMDSSAHLISVDIDPTVQSVAAEFLGHDPRVSFVAKDGLEFLRTERARSFDLVFADAVPGKYAARDQAMDVVKVGGLYVGDDMLPQPNWPPGHQSNVDDLLLDVRSRPDWAVVAPAWGSGFIIAVRR